MLNIYSPPPLPRCPMSDWVKSQSQETIFFLVLILLFAGFGGFLYWNKTQEAVADGEGGGFLSGLFEGVINIFITVPDTGDDEADDDGDDFTPPPSPPPSDITVPTSLSCSVIYPTLTMGQYQLGTVTSNGRNYPVTIYVGHRGTGLMIEIAGFLNDHGMWTSPPQKMGTPGYYEAWVETDTGVASPHIFFVVEGIKVLGESEHYSKTFKDSFLIEVVSHYKNTNVQIIGNYPAGDYSQPITSTTLNNLGYGSVAPSFDSLANGDWELDALIGSDRAALYEYGTWWVDIGR